MNIFIGLMSGTSLDAIDVVAASFEPEFKLLGSHSEPIPNSLREQILQLMQPGNNEIDLMGEVDIWIAEAFAKATNALRAQIDSPITAIGSHGQTIRHRPESGFTLQIGNPAVIAEKTGIDVVADFRRRDMAAGGQGAPLVPAFHDALFRSEQQNRILLNIGGMANITLLPKDQNDLVSGYDTGPGNILMDSWCQLHTGEAFDENGNWASTGCTNSELLHKLLALPYFSAPPPKSTGREQFNLNWLNDQIKQLTSKPEPADVQATLLEFTAQTIADAIKQHSWPDARIFSCGGGSHNRALQQRLQQLLPDNPLDTTANLGLDPDWVEASAFAWLAMRTLQQTSGNCPAVTGAKGARILGSIHYA